MRRRLRQQTRMREALLVDLGALVYELHRHGRREPQLLQAKASELTAVDQEVRGLADALGAGEGVLALVSAGIAGSCERCGTLLSTDARYCSGCGAEAAPSLPGSAEGPPEAGAAAAGVGIGGGSAAGEAVEERYEETTEPPVEERYEETTEPPVEERYEEEAEPPAEEPFEEEPDLVAEEAEPAERAPWLSDEDAGPDEDDGPDEADRADAAHEGTLAEPPSAPPATGRRRSGGAVGRVSGILRRGRDGG